jgi:alpha-L-fucosidase
MKSSLLLLAALCLLGGAAVGPAVPGKPNIVYTLADSRSTPPVAPGQQTTSTKPEPAPGRDARMKWWREARFGMFVHWGLYSGLAGNWNGKPVGTKGGMEWLQNRVGADTYTYASNALPCFRPKPGFAAEWARVAKEAGCRYVVFTTKHHDGFALHDSKVGDFDAGSQLNRDLVKEIVAALRAEGLRVGFYHSVIDWHHDQYGYTLAKGLPYPGGNRTAMPGAREHAKYVTYLHQQVDELMSNYGPVDIMWWDYSSREFQGDEAWRAAELLRRVRAKQPDIIVNNRLFRTPEAGWAGNGMATLPTLDPRYGDFTTPEQHIPATGMPGIDWETCMTMNTTWGFNEHDHAWKSEETLIRNLVDIASKGGNYLLNIGPTGDGSVPPESVKALRAIGAWMKVNGESIYGTTANPFPNLTWGTCTKKVTPAGGTLYLHILTPPADGQLGLPGLKNKITGVRLLGGGTITATSDGPNATVWLPRQKSVATNAVIALQFAGPLEVEN